MDLFPVAKSVDLSSKVVRRIWDLVVWATDLSPTSWVADLTERKHL